MGVMAYMLEFQDHDHEHCRDNLIEYADETCRARGVEFTKTRRKVLELLLEDHRPMGAYEILDKLAEQGMSSKPPVAYRALGFLVDHGFAHRIEKLNAYVACTYPGPNHSAAFLICGKCKTVAETDPFSIVNNVLAPNAISGFTPHSILVEVDGVCATCQEETS